MHINSWEVEIEQWRILMCYFASTFIKWFRACQMPHWVCRVRYNNEVNKETRSDVVEVGRE